MVLGRCDEALAQLAEARQLEPTSASIIADNAYRAMVRRIGLPLPAPARGLNHP